MPAAAAWAAVAVAAYALKRGHDAKVGAIEEADKQNQILQNQLNKPPPTIPDALSDTQAAQRASIVDQMRRRGRDSTILTNPSNTLGNG